MKQRNINLTCVLAAAVGISFGVGQTVGQDRAEAGPQATESATSNKAVVRELKKMKFELQKIAFATADSSTDLVTMSYAIGDRPKGTSSVRDLLRQICVNGAQFSYQC